MNRYRAAHANGNTIALGFFSLKGKHLAKAAHIQPGFTGSLCISIFIFFSFFHCWAAVCTVFQAFEAIIAAVVRLDKHILAKVHHAVADLAFQAHIRNFTQSLIRFARAVSVQRVTVRVRMVYSNHKCKVDFILQHSHLLFLLLFCFRFIFCIFGLKVHHLVGIANQIQLTKSFVRKVFCANLM